MNQADHIQARVSPLQRKLIAALRSLVRRSAPEAKETVLWDSISYHRPAVGGRVKGAVCLITPRPDAVHLGFIHGAALADPDHLLRGSQKSKRFVPIRRLADLRIRSFTRLIQRAAEYRPGSKTRDGVLPR